MALKPTPASEFKQAARKVHQLPSGRAVEIKKLTRKEILSLGLFPQNFVELTEEEKDKLFDKLKADPDRNLEVFEKVIIMGTVTPKISGGPIQDLADDEIHITDLGDDADDLFAAILGFTTGVPLDALRKALKQGAE